MLPRLGRIRLTSRLRTPKFGVVHDPPDQGGGDCRDAPRQDEDHADPCRPPEGAPRQQRREPADQHRTAHGSQHVEPGTVDGPPDVGIRHQALIVVETPRHGLVRAGQDDVLKTQKDCLDDRRADDAAKDQDRGCHHGVGEPIAVGEGVQSRLEHLVPANLRPPRLGGGAGIQHVTNRSTLRVRPPPRRAPPPVQRRSGATPRPRRPGPARPG